jgi:hypothetical protein
LLIIIIIIIAAASKLEMEFAMKEGEGYKVIRENKRQQEVESS